MFNAMTEPHNQTKHRLNSFINPNEKSLISKTYNKLDIFIEDNNWTIENLVVSK